MKLVLHRRIRSDVDEIMDYYERAEHPELAQDFYPPLRSRPRRSAGRGLRRRQFGQQFITFGD